MKKIAERQAETARQAKEIAAQAKEVATAKLNLDLFEKRMVIFEHAWSLIGYAAAGKSYDFAKLGMLQNKLHEAAFLFGKDIEDYLLNLRSGDRGTTATEQNRQRGDVRRPVRS